MRHRDLHPQSRNTPKAIQTTKAGRRVLRRVVGLNLDKFVPSFTIILLARDLPYSIIAEILYPGTLKMTLADSSWARPDRRYRTKATRIMMMHRRWKSA
jgi:hypothetical protein